MTVFLSTLKAKMVSDSLSEKCLSEFSRLHAFPPDLVLVVVHVVDNRQKARKTQSLSK